MCVFPPRGSGDVQGWGVPEECISEFVEIGPIPFSFCSFTSIHQTNNSSKMNAVTKAFTTAKVAACKLSGNNNDNKKPTTKQNKSVAVVRTLETKTVQNRLHGTLASWIKGICGEPMRVRSEKLYVS